MNVFAFILAVLAALSFAWAVTPHPAHPSAINHIALGLVFLTAAWIVATCVPGGTHVILR